MITQLRLLLLLILVLPVHQITSAQIEVPVRNPDVYPSIHGCHTQADDARKECNQRVLNMYVDGQVRYPASALEDSIEGTVKLEVTISAAGSLLNVKILEAPSVDLGKEAERLLMLYGTWRPAIDDDLEVTSIIPLEVNFSLEKHGDRFIFVDGEPPSFRKSSPFC